MLSRKYYILIAKIIAKLDNNGTIQTEQLINHFCSEFKADNYRFDQYRFKTYIRDRIVGQ